VEENGRPITNVDINMSEGSGEGCWDALSGGNNVMGVPVSPNYTSPSREDALKEVLAFSAPQP